MEVWYNGVRAGAAGASDASSLLGRAISEVAPSDGQVYAWSEDDDCWEAVSQPPAPLTANGDIYIMSGGAAARLPVGSDGQQLVVSGGLPAWDDPPTSADGAYDVDLSSSTYENGSVGGGSAAHVAGVARFAIGAEGQCDYLAGSSSAPRCRFALPAVRSAWRFRVEVRLASIGAGGSGQNIWHAVVGVKHGEAGYGAHLRIAFDGRPDLLQRGGAQVGTGAPGAIQTGGNGWVALEYDRDSIRVEGGVGDGLTPPASWEQIYASGVMRYVLGVPQPSPGSGTAAPAAPSEVYLALERNYVGIGSAATIDLGPVRVWDLGR